MNYFIANNKDGISFTKTVVQRAKTVIHNTKTEMCN